MGMLLLPVIGLLLLFLSLLVLICLVAFIATCWIHLQKGLHNGGFFIGLSGVGLVLSSYGLYKFLSWLGIV
ncbi:hypothetical protein [Xenorhabdus hominickii]|uniref:Uncharacterized protein n=1 Tax=Xenorhabdus hominickii TaxID=351679 RepID=A0A2G0Q608_XENHO|nr:hypothetical protein [Xenorhabdus hominickii]AOM39561.1 hypothetical protein A9255_02490 [Xenorhabdus hominickii]PHM54659.1 hypothetical protein Xhom_02609 [Xenorhabdus hominickii]